MNKKIISGIIIVVAVVAVAFLLYWVYQNYSASTTGIYSTVNNQTTTSSTTSTSNNPVQTSSLSYSDAVKMYGSRRIQFDANCVAQPNYVTFKRGTVIMLDNRANTKRVIALDTQRYTLNPYGFKIVTLNTSAQLPHTIMIDCGSGQNNARILLQQ